MKLISVKLESLDPDGVEIASDVTDASGRLLAKAPCALDPRLKTLLLARGVHSVTIRDKGEAPRVFDQDALEKEIDLLQKRLVHFGPYDREGNFVKMVVETVRSIYQQENVLPESQT